MQALESSGANPKISRGLWAEAIVIKFFRQKSYKLFCHRWRTKSFEVDLIFEKQDFFCKKLIICEVKTLSTPDFFSQRVSLKQKQRLQKAYEFFLKKYPTHEVRFFYAFVDSKKYPDIKELNIKFMPWADY